MKTRTNHRDWFVDFLCILCLIWMTVLAGMMVIGCEGPAPKIPVEEPTINAPVPNPCHPDLKGGERPDEVLSTCGGPRSKFYSHSYPDVIGWRYCGNPCRPQHSFIIYFWGGEVVAWSDVYEVLQ